MNKENEEKMLNLLADRAVFGLSAVETTEFEQLAKQFPELANDDSFEIIAAGFNLANLNSRENLPNHLNAKILADANKLFGVSKESEPEEFQKTFALASPKRSIFDSLGWLIAALACIALVVNIWLTRSQKPTEIGGVNPTPTVAPKIEPNPVQDREQLLASAADVVQTDWTNPKNPKEVLGDIVWSNSQQKGFVRFRNLPLNDASKETYQLWIIDKTQKKPIDGGVFDIQKNGEVIIPIDAKLKVKEPAQFAVTAEKPGGVPLSDLGKVMAVAKI